MDAIANSIIDHFGGTSVVAKLLNAPVSTVHSWRKIGIPPSRLAHLKLAAEAEGLTVPDSFATPTPREAA